MISWSCANVTDLSRRDRALITLAGIAPDVDGFGYVSDYLKLSNDLYCRFHHIWGHNIGACLVYLFIVLLVAKRKVLATSLAAVTFHLYLICDVISGRGPDDYQWPVPYLLPFSDAWNWTWSGQWYLHGWQNSVVYGIFLILTVFIAVKKKITPVELISRRWDEAVVKAFAKLYFAIFGNKKRSNAES